MKKPFISFCFLFFISNTGIAQDSLKINALILKANIFLTKNIRQYQFNMETMTKYKSQTNGFGLSLNYFPYLSTPSGEFRNTQSLSYRRYFYSSPISNKSNVYIAPYVKLINRRAKEFGSTGFAVFWPKDAKDFSANSVVLGLSSGFQISIYKGLIIVPHIGIGFGQVLNYTSKPNTVAPSLTHLDLEGLLQLGYRF